MFYHCVPKSYSFLLLFSLLLQIVIYLKLVFILRLKFGKFNSKFSTSGIFCKFLLKVQPTDLTTHNGKIDIHSIKVSVSKSFLELY